MYADMYLLQNGMEQCWPQPSRQTLTNDREDTDVSKCTHALQIIDSDIFTGKIFHLLNLRVV